jgi:mRNA interferase YafQ
MKYTVYYSSRFKKSLKRAQQLQGFKLEKIKEAISLLAEGKRLPANYKDHGLTGNMIEFRECHLAPDILLIYEIDEGVLILTLVNIGKHSQLFK